jgi:hypothetical protein
VGTDVLTGIHAKLKAAKTSLDDAIALASLTFAKVGLDETVALEMALEAGGTGLNADPTIKFHNLLCARLMTKDECETQTGRKVEGAPALPLPKLCKWDTDGLSSMAITKRVAATADPTCIPILHSA